MFNIIGPRPIGTAIIAMALAAILLVGACSDDEATPTASPGGDGATSQLPTDEALAPTPSPTPTTISSPTSTPTPTPIPFSVSLPLPPIPTPQPTATPDPNAPTPTPSPTPSPSWDDYGIEALQQLSCESRDWAREASEIVPVELYPLHRLYHSASLLDNGRIIFSGGFFGTAWDGGIFPVPHTTVDVYDPASESWCSIVAQEQFAYIGSTAILSDGTLLLLGIGAWDSSGDSTGPYAARLDPESLELTEIAPPPELYNDPELVLLDDGHILVVGQVYEPEDPDHFRAFVSDAAIYDPALDSWGIPGQVRQEPDLEFRLDDAIFAPQWLMPLSDNRAILVTTGDTAEGDEAGRVQIYDTATNSWRVVAEFLTGWDDVWHATVTHEGKLCIFYDERVEVYDLAAGEWAISYPYRVIPRLATTTLLSDGRILISGGAPEGNFSGRFFDHPTNRTDIFDPESLIWTSGPSLQNPRHGHSATALRDDSVLVYGGIGISAGTDELAPLNSLEVIEPSALKLSLSAEPSSSFVYPCWGLTSSPEPLPVVTDNRRDLPSARQLVADSLDAMKTAESFMLSSLSLSHSEGSRVDLMRSQFADCLSSSYVYEAPDRWQSESIGLQGRGVSYLWPSITIGNKVYRDTWGDGRWRVSSRDPDEPFHGIDLALNAETLDDSTIAWETVAIERLNDEDVVHIRGEKSEGQGSALSVTTYDYWIGATDNLIRRVYRYRESPDYNDAEKRRRHYELITVAGFGDNFNIQPPLTPEEAAQPEASGASICASIQGLEPLPQAMVSGGGVLESASDIILRATQAMDAVSSYAALHLSLGYQRSKDPENIIRIGGDCRYRQIEISEPDRLSRRDIIFEYGEIQSDDYLIAVGQEEYIRQSSDGEWTATEPDGATRFAWLHTKYLSSSDDGSGANFQLIGIESLDGVAVYHVSEHEVASGDGSERTLSVWIGVDDLLVRRVSIVTRMDNPDQNVIGGGAITVIHHLINLRSFNEDFNIQPPPENEIAE